MWPSRGGTVLNNIFCDVEPLSFCAAAFYHNVSSTKKAPKRRLMKRKPNRPKFEVFSEYHHNFSTILGGRLSDCPKHKNKIKRLSKQKSSRRFFWCRAREKNEKKIIRHDTNENENPKTKIIENA